jgi:regulatory protein
MTSGLSDEITKAKKFVFRLLKYRTRSYKELQERLKAKKFSPDVISQVIDYFDKLGLINDQVFALTWLNSRLGKPLGLRRIFFELKQKGISNEIIEEVQNKIKDNYNEYEVVQRLARDKIDKLKCLDQNKAKRRIYNFLIRRGFSVDIINDVINRL